MEMRQLRYFLAVAEQLHFTRAAELLHVAQPALSQQIATLEREIGAKLLERAKRRVQLTPAGRAFREKVTLALEQTREAVLDAQRIESGEGGSIVVGFVSTAAVVALPAVLGELCRRLPAATFELHEMDPAAQLEAMERNRIDLGLTSVLLNYPGVESKLLYRGRMVVALPSGHPAARHRQIDLKLLSTERLLLPSRHSLAGLHDQILATCHEAGFTPTRVQQVKRAEVAVCLVAAQIGVAVVPSTFQNLCINGVVYRELRQNLPFEVVAIRRRKNNSHLLDALWSHIGSADLG